MLHFAYPNAKITQSKFIGCGRYIALPPGNVPLEGYYPADPRTVNIEAVMMTASILAPESFETGKEIYRKKDIPDEGYQGDSQALAYLLTLISRSRKPRLEGIQRDIWCTGSITISNGKHPVLEAVNSAGFDIKLNAFLSDENPDNLFIVPMSNIRPIHETLFTTDEINVIPLDYFPDFSVQDLFERKTIVKVPPFELGQLIEAVFKKPELSESFESIIGFNPYRGLFVFREEDAEFFFGRETYIQRLIKMVQNQPLVAVVGASGSGKSSVVYAGLLPQLRRRENWQIVSFRPGDHPFWALSSVLLSLLEPNLDEIDRIENIKKLSQKLTSGNLSLNDVLQAIFQKAPDTHLLIFIDQFEELYTLCLEDECHQFLDELLQTFNGSAPLNTGKDARHLRNARHLVLTMRADFLGKALAYRPFADVLQQGTMMLGPMNWEELRETIEKPAERLGVDIEQGLTDRILDAVGDEPGHLPLVEFALTQLWEKQMGIPSNSLSKKRRKNEILTHAAYDEVGGVKQALACYAESVYDDLTEQEQRWTQHVFTQLVHPGEGTEDTRRVATRKEIGEERWTLVTKLADARLVVTGSTNISLADRTQTGTFAGHQKETVEVVHETLITGWQRLQEWINAGREFRMWQDRLRAIMPRSESGRYDEGGLLRGTALTNAEEWLNKRRNDLSQYEQRFIELSLHTRKKLQRRKKFGIMAVLAIAIIVTVVFGILWKHAEIQRQLVIEQKSIADEQRQIVEMKSIEALSVSSKALFLSYDGLGAMLAIVKAGKILQQTEIPDELRELVILNFQEIMNNVYEKNRLEAHTAPVITLMFSSDGAILASGSTDGTIILWNVKDGSIIKTLQGHSGIVLGLDFSQDNTILASGSSDNMIKLWNIEDGQEIKTLQGHSGAVHDVTFNPDGTMLVSSSQDHTIKLWDVANDREINTLRGHFDAVSCISFSPDGTKLASGSDDHTIKLWDVANWHEIMTLQGHSGIVYSVDFSADSKRLVSGSGDGILKFWNVSDGSEITTLQERSGFISSVHFSPDGLILASGSSDKTIKLWAVEEGMVLNTLQGHADAVYDVSFRPDGEMLASGSWDKTIRLWKVNKEIVHSSSLDELLVAGCQWMQGYLKTNPNVSPADRVLCDDILH